MSGIGKLMKQASRIQKNMEEVQAELTNRTVEASSGGGAVRAVVKCDGTLESIKIDPQAVNAEEIGLLEDLVLAAVNSGLNQAKEVSNHEMDKVTSSLQGLIRK